MWKIYVGNLSSRIREMELSNEFRPYGLVRSIWIARNPPGYAFVEFDSRQEACDAISALDGKHGWRVEMSRRSSSGIRSRSSSRDTRCRECGSRRHNARDCRFRASQSSRRSLSPHSKAHMGSPKRKRSRSQSRQHNDEINERSPKNHANSFLVKSECSRSAQNVQNKSPSACSAAVNEDSPSQKNNNSKSPQNDLIDPQTDGYASKELEHSSSPLSGSSRFSNFQKDFESDSKRALLKWIGGAYELWQQRFTIDLSGPMSVDVDDGGSIVF